MNADEKRKVFVELLDEYQDVISSEFSYEDGGYEAARRAWLNKYDGIKEPLIKDEKIRKAVRAWADAEGEDCYYGVDATTLHNGSGDNIEFWSRPFKDLEVGEHYSIAELCGEEEE
jgi:hypothetical protein